MLPDAIRTVGAVIKEPINQVFLIPSFWKQAVMNTGTMNKKRNSRAPVILLIVARCWIPSETALVICVWFMVGFVLYLYSTTKGRPWTPLVTLINF